MKLIVNYGIPTNTSRIYGEIMNLKSHTLAGRNNISKGLSNSDKPIGRPQSTVTSEETKAKMRISASKGHRDRLDMDIVIRKFIDMYPDAIRSNYKTKYDFITNDGLRTSVKSSTLAKSGKDWRFSIYRNKETDTFSLFAFDTPKDKNLLFVWIVPSEEISHLTGISISIGTLPKWDRWVVYRNDEYYKDIKSQDKELINYWLDPDNVRDIDRGQDIIEHHEIYDHANPSKYTIEMTRSEHSRLHVWMRKMGVEIPHINEEAGPWRYDN